MKKLLPVFLIILSVLLSSCAVGRGESCDAVLYKLLPACAVGEQGGTVYSLGASQVEEGYIGEELQRTLYGEKAEKYFSLIEDCAIFLSAREPAEIAVFKCYSASDTDEIARMCLERADAIKVSLRNSAWRDKIKGIRVIVDRRFVVLLFVEDTAKVEEKLRQMI